MPKKWSEVLSELERSIPILATIEDSKNLLNQFESVENKISDEQVQKLYLKMWKVALVAGKLSLANSYARNGLAYLIEYKRIPKIKIFIRELLEAGLFKNSSEEFINLTKVLLGKKENLESDDLINIEMLINHSEHWKKSAVFLKQYLLLEESWDLGLWKLCYEFILKNHFDKELFIVLLDRSREMKNKEFEKKLLKLFEVKKIKIPNYKAPSTKPAVIANENLNLNYDQVAMDLLSGAIEPSMEEQRRVINSLKFIPQEELTAKGQDMIVAFELLGMEQVVLTLCESVMKVQTDVKQRASTYYVWSQALFNTNDFYKAIDLIDEVLQSEPLYGEERLAFLYLKAEACLKLNKLKMAKDLYSSIKKQNANYRLVGERLKQLEKT